jgi:CRISPR-associated protein Csm1
MIVLGDISGIQRYLFDVSETGGGQARRLRARSFLVQMLTECAALRVLRSMHWLSPSAHFLFSGAGKFILRGSGEPEAVRRLSEELNTELLRETCGELRVSLAVGDGSSDVAAYRQAQSALQQAKATPWQPTGVWEPNRLTLPPLDTPCALCRRAPAIENETDPDSGEPRRVCRHCSKNYRLGRSLPHARVLILREGTDGDFSWFGLTGELVSSARVNVDSRTIGVIGLDGEATTPSGCPQDSFVPRRLMASVLLDHKGDPVWFTELAKQASGDHLLAVLKADVDSLGVQIEQRLQGRTDLTDFLRFADSLDAFFAGELRQEIARNRQWQPIYTVFAGGDDLVMIGPWDVMFRFAGHVRELFRRKFPELTLSAGVSLFKPKRPVKTAIEQADRLLECAKEAPKDHCAAFGQVWNWKHHGMILGEAERLTSWVQANQIQRGWLHTLLELSVARHGDTSDPLATARLAYHVNRNYRQNTDARRWADALVCRFDDAEQPEIRYLPTMVRHALTATRSAG